MVELTVTLADDQIEIFQLACEHKIGLDNVFAYHEVEKDIMQQICNQLTEKEN